MINPAGIHLIDVLYRVSTRSQELEGDSLLNQRREVEEKWAIPHGIAVRKRIEVTESGKSALRLSGPGFVFNRRAEYTQLIVDYQDRCETRPDAVVIDWVDRWSRNVLEYSGIIAAFRMLGIRLLAIGDGLDLTDPANDLIAHIRAAVGQEQIRITSSKIREARRSRRERGVWQGGSAPDGFRTHDLTCAGRHTVARDTVDGKRHTTTVRACDCDPTVLYRDPDREAVIQFIWSLLKTSPLSWGAMSDQVNAAGFRRPNGTPFRWHDLYRIGQNPHYAGGMTTNRYGISERQTAKKHSLREEIILWDSESIIDPYVTKTEFLAIYARRFNKQTRNLPRNRGENTSELLGILMCPGCGRQMSTVVRMSPKVTGHGNPRISPRKRYANMQCSHANQYHPTCQNRTAIRVATVSRLLLEKIQELATFSDAAVLEALKLRQSQSSAPSLESERKRLVQMIVETDALRRAIQRLVARGVQTQAEAEEDLFHHQRVKADAQTRIRQIDIELRSQSAKPDFVWARQTISWLRDSWDVLTVREKAEALRILIRRATYQPNGTVHPTFVQIVEYGSAFVTPGEISQDQLIRRA